MQKNEYITITITLDQVKDKLKKCIGKDVPNKDVIVDVIIDNLKESEVGISQLYNSFSGIRPCVHVNIGDEVLIPMNYMPSWRMDKNKMAEAGMLEKDMVRAVVEDIKLSRTESIKVRYSSIDSAGNKTEDGTYDLKPEYVHLNTEEYPEDLNSGF